MRLILSAVLLLGAAQAAAQPYAYVPNAVSNDVSVIDTATNSVVDTIPVGLQPWGVAVSPDGSRVVVPTVVGNDASIIDTGTNTVIATIPLGSSSYGVAIHPDGSEAWVPNVSGSISIIDLATNTLETTIAVPGQTYFGDFTPDGSRFLVPVRSGAQVIAIDTTTRTIVDTYAVGASPISLTVSPDGSEAWVAHDSGSNVAVIDLGTGTVATVPGTNNNASIALLPDGSRAYAANYNGTTARVIDTATLTVVGDLAGLSPNGPIGVAVAPDGSRVYVSDRNANAVAVFDAATNASVGTIAVGTAPYAIGRWFATGGTFGGVQLDGPPSPVLYAEEIVASAASPVTLADSASLQLSANLGYSFSIGEVRYARFECNNGMRFGNDSTASYAGGGSAGLGAINGLGGSAMYFSVTANDNNVTADGRLVIDGSRRITGTQDVTCTYSLYDFPSQAQAGGPSGRVYTVSGPYLSFAPSYALVVDSEGNPVADVESNDPAYSEFVNQAPTFDVTLGNLGGFSYGTVNQVNGSTQPRAPSGAAVTLADLMDADTALVFTGDFAAAADVFFSPNADCSVNIQSADGFDDVEAVFTIGSNAAMDHYLCYEAGGDPIRASEFTVALDAVSANPALWNVGDRGPLDLGAITRNGTQLQAPFVQVPATFTSRLVLTNTGPQDRPYEIAVFGEAGNTISTANLTGTIPATGTTVVDLKDVLTGFTGEPRGTIHVTVSGPDHQIQGLYQIVNPDSGTISNHVMVRPGLN